MIEGMTIKIIIVGGLSLWLVASLIRIAYEAGLKRGRREASSGSERYENEV